MIEKNNPKTIKAWAMYDWANSVYPLVITTAIFPIFYSSAAIHESRLVDGQSVDYVRFFGVEFINTELYSYVLSLSFLIVSFISPLLSGIADYTGSKKKFLKFFCYLGSAGCAALAFFSKDYLEVSMLFILIASIGYWGSLVFYNAFLPEIADTHLHDRVSAQGFAYGYIGSSILLVANLAVILTLGNEYVTYCFISVALWWVGFAQLTYKRLPDNPYNRKPSSEYIWKGYEELKQVWKELGDLTNIKRFLRSFFVYSMGVQTVMVMAVLFAKKEIDWQGQGDTGLIVSVLIIQFIAVFGAYMFARLSSKIGNVPVLLISLLIWIGVCLAAYFISTPFEFYMLAVLVGLVMGGIQALSRSTYSKMLPETIDHASYFSFYDVVEKLGFVIGAFLFGLIEGVTSSMRYSALALLSFFVIGFLLLLMVKKEDSISPQKA
ncbi:MAG: MFS transporter [Flavobacteriales bacterium]